MKTYEQAYNTPSDIYLHLPALYGYAVDSSKVVEIGLGTTSNAIRAFLKGCKDVTSIDIDPMPNVVKDVQEYADHLGCKWEFIVGDSIQTDIPECDLLFIDGKHSYYTVIKELFKHHTKVNKFIGFHDVISYASRNESPEETGNNFIEGIVPAIFMFLEQHPEWKVDYYSPYCNGLLILAK